MIQLNSSIIARGVPFKIGGLLLALLGFAGQICAAHTLDTIPALGLCEQSLQGVEAKSFLDLSMASEPASKEATVQATAILEGEKVSHFRLWRYGSNWDSAFIEGKMAVQGDPRALIIILGEETAAWFGLKMISGEELQIPSIHSFNLRIESANQFLKGMSQEEIAARFYYSLSQTAVADRAYLARIQNYQFPIAMDGRLLVHDISYHLASILIPKIMLDRFSAQSRVLLAAFNELRLNLENESEAIQHLFFSVERRILSVLASGIDTAAGNIVLVTEARGKIARHKSETHYYQAHALDLVQNLSLRNLIAAWSRLARASVLEQLSPRQEDQYGLIPSLESQQEIHRLQKLVADFETNFLLNLPEELDRELDLSHQQLAEFIDSRIESLRTGITKKVRK